MKINREMKNINGLINFNLCHSMILWFWMKILISDFFFWEKEGHNQKVIAIYISNEIEERETHTHARDAEYHPADFKENLYTEMHPPLEFLDFFHGGITLCIYVIPLFYPHFFFPPPLTLSLSLSYLHPFFRLSFRILIIPVALFSFFSFFFFFLSPLSLQAHWKNTSKGGNNSFLASWNSFNQSVLFSKITFITFYYSGTAMLLQKRKL